jgi:hypothetical protein
VVFYRQTITLWPSSLRPLCALIVIVREDGLMDTLKALLAG